MRVALFLTVVKRLLAALHRCIVVAADHLRVFEQLAAVRLVSRTQPRQQTLAVVPVDGRRMVPVVEHRPELEAGIGDRHANAIPLCELQCFLEPQMFVSIEHCPDVGPRAATEAPLEFYRLLDNALRIEPVPSTRTFGLRCMRRNSLMYCGSVFSPSVTTITCGLSACFGLPREGRLERPVLLAIEGHCEIANHGRTPNAALPIHLFEVFA